MMKIVAIKEMSTGNETVGDMWKETKIFDESSTVKEVIEWATYPRKNVILTVAEESADPERSEDNG